MKVDEILLDNSYYQDGNFYYKDNQYYLTENSKILSVPSDRDLIPLISYCIEHKKPLVSKDIDISLRVNEDIYVKYANLGFMIKDIEYPVSIERKHFCVVSTVDEATKAIEGANGNDFRVFINLREDDEDYLKINKLFLDVSSNIVYDIESGVVFKDNLKVQLEELIKDSVTEVYNNSSDIIDFIENLIKIIKADKKLKLLNNLKEVVFGEKKYDLLRICSMLTLMFGDFLVINKNTLSFFDEYFCKLYETYNKREFTLRLKDNIKSLDFMCVPQCVYSFCLRVFSVKSTSSSLKTVDIELPKNIYEFFNEGFIDSVRFEHFNLNKNLRIEKFYHLSEFLANKGVTPEEFKRREKIFSLYLDKLEKEIKSQKYVNIFDICLVKRSDKLYLSYRNELNVNYDIVPLTQKLITNTRMKIDSNKLLPLLDITCKKKLFKILKDEGKTPNFSNYNYSPQQISEICCVNPSTENIREYFVSHTYTVNTNKEILKSLNLRNLGLINIYNEMITDTINLEKNNFEILHKLQKEGL